jgi:Trypsin-like peptidase domain
VMRRMRGAALCVVLVLGLAPFVSAGAADNGRVKASQLVKSVVLINTFSCGTPPTVGETSPVPFQEQRCDGASWKGSGAVIDTQGHILTNDHVIRPDLFGSQVDPATLGWYLIYQTVDAKELPVAVFYARAIASDRNLDLAILEPAWQLDGQPIGPGEYDGQLPALPMSPDPATATLDLGDTLRLLGYPRDHPLVTASTVNVSGFEDDSGVPQLKLAWIRTDVASAGPGNSGGPAVNDAGLQIGVVSRGSRNELECQDYNGDGVTDPGTECQTASGGAEYIRPIPEAYNLMLQEQPTEPSPTPTTEAPPAPPEETPTATDEAPQPPEVPTEEPPQPPEVPTDTLQPTQAPEPTPTAEGAAPSPPNPDTGTAIVIGTLVSADTGDPIPNAMVVVLKPGVSVKAWKRGSALGGVYSQTKTDGRGNFQLPDPVQRGEKYGIWLGAPRYEELYREDWVLATEDDPPVVDIGVIEMPLQT